jgi:hypothetical protein
MAIQYEMVFLFGFLTLFTMIYFELIIDDIFMVVGWSNIISSEGDPNPCPSSTPSSSTSTTSTTMTTTTSSPQSPNLPVPPTPSTAPQSSPQSPSTTSSNPSTTRQAINQTSQTLIDPGKILVILFNNMKVLLFLIEVFVKRNRSICCWNDPQFSGNPHLKRQTKFNFLSLSLSLSLFKISLFRNKCAYDFLSRLNE